MKKTYIQPTSTIIVMSEALCSFLKASVVEGGTGNHVDDIKVEENDETLDWSDVNSWGGD